MQLKHHPTFSYRGFSLWPPRWISQATSASTPVGEVGVLRDVRWYPDTPIRVFLTMEHDGVEFRGHLFMEYELMSMVMVSLLEHCKGMTIGSIGILEIPFVIENAVQQQLAR